MFFSYKEQKYKQKIVQKKNEKIKCKRKPIKFFEFRWESKQRWIWEANQIKKWDQNSLGFQDK